VVSASVVATAIDYRFKIISSSAFPTEGDLIGFFVQFYAWSCPHRAPFPNEEARHIPSWFPLDFHLSFQIRATIFRCCSDISPFQQRTGLTFVCMVAL
jgi:hypothetical protein